MQAVIWGTSPRAGFPTGVENMGGVGLFKIMGGWGLSQYMGRAWGGLKMLLKNICEGVHLLVKLPAISLQPCNLLKISRILARF